LKMRACHNGTVFNKGQLHPSYTMLLYLERALGIITGSHVSLDEGAWNLPTVSSDGVVSRLEEIECGEGDAIVFNANLIHVGTMLDKRDHLRVLTHRDRNTLDFHKVQQREPKVSDWTQVENIRTSKKGEDVGWKQSVFSTRLFVSPDFYDLNEAGK